MAQTIDQIMQGLNAQYDPRRQMVNQQMNELPGQETAAIAGLDQAKTNSFNQINNAANARGMAYSGAPIDEQQTYLGSTYMPARAQVTANTQQQKYRLQDALLGLNTEQANTAAGLRETQLNRDLQDSQFKQQQAASERQMQMQAQLQRESLAAQQQAAAAKTFKVSHDASGGWQIKMPDGSGGTLAQYAASNGGNIMTVLQYLSQGSKGDQATAQQIMKQYSGRDLTNDAKAQAELKRKYSNIFGGI